MTTYRTDAHDSAPSDEDAAMPLIVRVATSGPHLGRRTVIEGRFTPAAECERNADYCERLYRAGDRVAQAREAASRRQSAQWTAYHARRTA